MLYKSIFSKQFTNLYFKYLLFQKMILSTHIFCLLNLSTTPQLCPSLLLSYTFDVLDHIHQHKQSNTIRYLLCAIYYALCTMHYLLCTMRYSLCTMHYALFTMHYALCTMYTYLYVFICIYYFIRIYTYSLFHMEIRRNPVILVLTRSSRHVE